MFLSIRFRGNKGFLLIESRMHSVYPVLPDMAGGGPGGVGLLVNHQTEVGDEILPSEYFDLADIESVTVHAGFKWN